MRIDRRDFLRFAGGAAVGTAVGGVTAGGMATLNEVLTEEEAPPSGEERRVYSVCDACPGGCGIRVRVVGGRAVKIDGSPLYPVNRGGLCPKGQAGLQMLYHPDRLRGPMRQTGERGSGRWQQIGWEEAIGAVAQRLGEIRGRSGPQTVAAVVGGEDRGLMRRLWERFLTAYGSPNLIRMPTDQGAAEAALGITQGVDGPIGYDLENTRYILSFGAGLLEGYGAPGWLMKTYGAWRLKHPRTRLIQVDSRLSITAAKADEWIPIRPGTEAVLALGIAYVIMRERLYDEAFVDRHTFGFEGWTGGNGRWHPGFKDAVFKDYGLEQVAGATGVSVETILRIGREFAGTRPALALGDLGGIYDQAAVHSLNALVGSIDTPGGALIRSEIPSAPWPPLQPDGVAGAGLRTPRLDGADRLPLAGDALQSLPEALLGEKPYGLEALLFHDAGPLSSETQMAAFDKAMQEIPFVVSIASFMDETTRHADIVLPEHTYLERWEDAPAPPTFPYPVYGIRKPVVAPLHDTRHTGDVLIALARKLEGSVGRAFPWEGFEEVLRADVHHVFEARRGNVMTTESEAAWGRLFERSGWWAPSYRSPEELWEQMLEKGGWWDGRYDFGEWGRVFRTPSGRFEFYSQYLEDRVGALADGGGEEAVLDGLGIPARGDRAYMPHAEFPAVDDGDYPFYLRTYELLALSHGRGAELPFLQESLAPHLRNAWDSWAEISAEAAGRLGISDGDPVWVESAAGRIRLRARIYEGALPDVVGIPLGLGRQAAGRWAKGRGVDPGALLTDGLRSPGRWTAGATRVRIHRA